MALGQILSNLISNAVKFTEHGMVSVSVHGAPAPGRRTIFACSSASGTQAVEYRRPRSRDCSSPTRRADDSVSRKHGGTGLGLPISLELAKLLGGGITVESELGKGSVFLVEIAARLP